MEKKFRVQSQPPATTAANNGEKPQGTPQRLQKKQEQYQNQCRYLSSVLLACVSSHCPKLFLLARKSQSSTHKSRTAVSSSNHHHIHQTCYLFLPPPLPTTASTLPLPIPRLGLQLRGPFEKEMGSIARYSIVFRR